MKKTTKVLLMLALAFFIVGAALGIASLSAGFRYSEFAQNIEDGRFNLIGPAEWSKKVTSELAALPGVGGSGKTFEQTYTGVNALQLKVGRADCEIIPYDGQDWKVEGEHLNSRFDCELDDGELCVSCKGPLLSFIGTKNNTAKLKLYAPRDQILEKVDIEAGVGTVAMSEDGDFLRCDQLDLECGVGETDICADIRREAKIAGGVGEVHITLAGKEEDFNYKVEYGVGDVTIDHEKHSGIGGDYKVDNDAEKDLRIECGVGSVELNFREDSAGHYAEDDALISGRDKDKDHDSTHYVDDESQEHHE